MNKIIIAFAALIAAASAAPLKGSSSMLEEWETFKTVHNKSYPGSEENFRYNIFLTTKSGVETHNKLYDNKLVSYRRELDQWADAKLNEIDVPGADKLSATEWNEYKKKHDKNYSAEEDEFRRTLYSRSADEVKDFNKLYENGIVSWSLRINRFTDHTNNEGPSYGLIIPSEEYHATGLISPIEGGQTTGLIIPDVSERTPKPILIFPSRNH